MHRPAPLLLLLACNEHSLVSVEHQSEHHHAHWGLPLSVAQNVDILFVIDDSDSMGPVQANLTRDIAAFVDVLETNEVASYRIAITTTDGGGCEADAEAGNFVFSSCRGRTDTVACERHCPEQWSEIPRSHPWIEASTFTTNLPQGLDVATALQCLLPQGTAGCDLEAPLDSMLRALHRAREDGEDEFGFLRDDAVLAIVFVTDEADCSKLPDADTVSSSAACWDAGVRCDATYETCVPEDNELLHPVDRYIDYVTAFEDLKQQLNPGREVVVAAIAGVPRGYPEVPLEYAPGPAGFAAEFGIGPGCASPVTRAVPPVRLAAFADAFGHNLFSVCEISYVGALETIADKIRAQIRPACMPACVADHDPDTPGLQPSCHLTHDYRTEAGQLIEHDIPECDPGEVIPDDETLCYVPLTAPDEMDEACVEEGWNLEFKIIRSPDETPPPFPTISADCNLSKDKRTDCPGLPGT